MNLKQAKELVRGRLSDKRYEHTLNVKKMADMSRSLLF